MQADHIDAGPATGEFDASVRTLILSRRRMSRFCSWFDKLTTSDVYSVSSFARVRLHLRRTFMSWLQASRSFVRLFVEKRHGDHLREVLQVVVIQNSCADRTRSVCNRSGGDGPPNGTIPPRGWRTAQTRRRDL